MFCISIEFKLGKCIKIYEKRYKGEFFYSSSSKKKNETLCSINSWNGLSVLCVKKRMRISIRDDESVLFNLSQSNVAFKARERGWKIDRRASSQHNSFVTYNNFSKSMKNMFTVPYLHPPPPHTPNNPSPHRIHKMSFFLSLKRLSGAKARKKNWIENAFHILSFHHHRHHSIVRTTYTEKQTQTRQI